MKSIALEDVWLKRNDKCSNLRKKKRPHSYDTTGNGNLAIAERQKRICNTP